LWTDGDVAIPIDWRAFNKKHDGLTKNNHMCHMLEKAHRNGFSPICVLFDSWYSTLKNLKMIREWGWGFFVGVRSNRQVDPNGNGNPNISNIDWNENKSNEYAHLKGFGWVEAYRSGENSCFVGTKFPLCERKVQQRREAGFQIENSHQGIKQECNVERCQARKLIKQLNHIALSLRAFIRLEINRYLTGISRHMMKLEIVREAVRTYRSAPIYTLRAPSA